MTTSDGGSRQRGKSSAAKARRAVLRAPVADDEPRPLSSSVRVDVAAASCRGAGRRHNDDHFLVIQLGRTQETILTSLHAADIPASFAEQAYAMLVADGLGDDGAGSVASRVALSTIAHLSLHHGKWNVRVDPISAADIMKRAQEFFDRADVEVFEKSLIGPPLSEIATSLTAAYTAGDSLFVAHVGHSRAYLVRNGTLALLTRDHTLEHKLAASKRPVSVERRAQDVGHILTDAIGSAGGTPWIDVEQFRLADGDSVLLCTNGLTDVVDDERIAETLTSPRKPEEQCALLIEAAKELGAADNVTVVLAHYRIPSI